MPQSDSHASATRFLHALVHTPDAASTLISLTASEREHFIQWADAQRITPQLYGVLSGLDLPTDIRTHLRESTLQTLPGNLALKAAGNEFRERLREVGIESLPFKGPWLAEHLYGGLSHRWCYDCDIFVQEADVTKARDVLIAMDYAPEGPNAPLDLLLAYRHELGFIHPTTGCRIELHWRIVPAFIPCNLTVNTLFDRAAPDAPEGLSYLTPELAFVLLTTHGNRHGWSHLCWVLDLIQLLRTETVDQQVILAIAKEFKLVRAVTLAWSLIASIPGTKLKSVESELARDWFAPINDGWLSADPDHSPSYKYLASTLDTGVQRLNFWSRLIFQPTVADFETLPLPGPLRWLNALVRPLRLLKRGRDRQ